MEVKKMQFAGACKDFFGYKPGQGLSDFSKELKALTPQDRIEIKEGLEKNGYFIEGFQA